MLPIPLMSTSAQNGAIRTPSVGNTRGVKSVTVELSDSNPFVDIYIIISEHTDLVIQSHASYYYDQF